MSKAEGLRAAAEFIHEWMAIHDWTNREDAHKELTHVAAELAYLADNPDDDE